MHQHCRSIPPLLAALLLASSWCCAASVEEVSGYWRGYLTYQGADLAGTDYISSEVQGFGLELHRADRPASSVTDLRFGAFEPQLEGSLYLPPGDGPHPVVVLIAGSGNAQRSDAFYGSWVEFYLDLGVGAFVYDRRPELARLPDGRILGIEDHAADVADAIAELRSLPSVAKDSIGLAGHSRGSWIAMAVANQVGDIAFAVLSSPAAGTPAEQEVNSVLTGMRQDGVAASDIAAARTYLGLYFYVAQTGRGWDTLATAIDLSRDTNWLQYVDQPRTLDDLDWWHDNMDFDALSELGNIEDVALWGGADFITPWVEYRLALEDALAAAGNDAVTTEVFDRADHRLRIDAGQDDTGDFYWFGMAPGVLDTITAFVHGAVRN